ncbi:MAG: YebC/PmpR family DNA-binding transcriptional regulator [Candidatus Babeliales bacterium]
MSGHSKWATIKRKKAAIDAKRGKAFTKLIKEISVVARMGGGDPAGNPRLRLLIDKAKEINMPQDNIVRAIKKGTGELPGQQYEPFIYEGYGPNGIAIIVETLSDNKNRTVGELRHLFSTNGGSLGETGSVNWMFERMGVIEAESNTMTEDALLETLIDYAINDISVDENWFTIQCDPKSLDEVKQVLINNGMRIESAQLEWVPKTQTTLPTDKAEKSYEFLSELDNQDDVQNVYTNLA